MLARVHRAASPTRHHDRRTAQPNTTAVVCIGGKQSCTTAGSTHNAPTPAARHHRQVTVYTPPAEAEYTHHPQRQVHTLPTMAGTHTSHNGRYTHFPSQDGHEITPSTLFLQQEGDTIRKQLPFCTDVQATTAASHARLARWIQLPLYIAAVAGSIQEDVHETLPLARLCTATCKGYPWGSSSTHQPH
jgi:hypothetical protein